MAHKWAMSRKIACSIHPANWSLWGKAAGPIRNHEMLLENPDVVVAFPGGRGTEDMVNRAYRAGILVHRPIKARL